MEHELSAPRRRATAAERLQTIELFQRSGLTRAAFSQQYQIPLAKLNRWLAKAQPTLALPAPMPILFGEVRLPPPPSTAMGGWAMELVSSSGLTVRCREALAIQALVRLLRAPRC